MTAAATITDRSTLPQYKGEPVPWVTRWTGEVSQDKLQVSIERSDRAVHLNYEDGNEDRDEHDVLWKREGLGRNGEPQYSQLNGYRQRASMRRQLCQICGTKIDERPIRWLLGKDQLNDEEGGPVTISPPTCSACIPLALELCPYLKRAGYAIVKVLEYERWGIYGEAIQLDYENEKYRDLRGVYVPYANPPVELSAVAAFQQIVQFTKFVFEKGFSE